MKQNLLSFLVILFFIGCDTRKGPDVSDIKINLQTERFEQDFFAIDTTRFGPSMQKLYEKYPEFFQDFVYNILGLPAQNENPVAVEEGVKSFIRSYKPVKDSADKVFKNFDPIALQISNGLKHVRYYFPQYKTPEKLITFIGPINSYGNIITRDAIAIGLQLYMGKDYTLYQSEAGQQLYPLYISKRFEPAYIAAGAMKNIISDMYPDKSAGKPLVEQMIEAGKRLIC